MLVLPPTIAFLRDPHQHIDWELIKTTLWLYLAVFVIYVISKVIKTAWKLDGQHLTTIEELDARHLATIGALEAQIENFKLAAESTKPQFRITIRRAILDSFYERGDLFVNVRVVNTSRNSTTIEKVTLKNHENGNTLIPFPFGQRAIPAGRTHYDRGITETGGQFWNEKKILEPLTDVLPVLTAISIEGSGGFEGWLMFPSSSLEPFRTVSVSLELEDMHGTLHKSGVVQLLIEEDKVFV
jgi:hypothetical protein